MATIVSPLDDDARRVTGDALQQTLIDLIDLSLLGKQAHWNVVGRNFRSVHLHLDEIVAAARLHSDSVAERAITVGVNPDGQAATVAKSAVPELPGGYLRDADVPRLLSERLQQIIERLRSQIAATADPDPVSQDLLIGVCADLEKHYWMLQAQIDSPA